MTKFRYTGPTTGITLADGQSLVLSRGATYELNPADPALKLHLHFRRLESLPEPAAPPKKTKKATPELAIVALPDFPESTTTTEGGLS